MSQLEAMGFPTIRCQKALLATGNSDADTAMTWLFEHMEDPGKLCYSQSCREADYQISMRQSRLPAPMLPSLLGLRTTKLP
jgi:uncharacterized UBP type Zn finger protein